MTLAQTPEQNGKQEVFFSQTEGRLMPMLDGEPNLTLELLNRATSDWVEEEYQRHLHSETKQSPLERTLTNLTIRVARWDLSSIDLVDGRRETHLATLFPVDREKNAERRRREIGPATADNAPEPVASPVGIAPLLRKLMADYAATGFPPPYVPRNNNDNNEEQDS